MGTVSCVGVHILVCCRIIFNCLIKEQTMGNMSLVEGCDSVVKELEEALAGADEMLIQVSTAAGVVPTTMRLSVEGRTAEMAETFSVVVSVSFIGVDRKEETKQVFNVVAIPYATSDTVISPYTFYSVRWCSEGQDQKLVLLPSDIADKTKIGLVCLLRSIVNDIVGAQVRRINIETQKKDDTQVTV